MTVNLNDWAKNQLPEDSDIGSTDDVPLTEDERNLADRLIKDSYSVTDEPTRMVKLTDTSIEMLQHGLILVKTVLDVRKDYLVNKGGGEYTSQRLTEVEDSMRNTRQLYAWLENSKDQLPI